MLIFWSNNQISLNGICKLDVPYRSITDSAAFKISFRRIWTDKHCRDTIRFSEIRIAQVCTIEICSDESYPSQVGRSQTGVTKVHDARTSYQYNCMSLPNRISLLPPALPSMRRVAPHVRVALLIKSFNFSWAKDNLLSTKFEAI
jgi:hypothetical protein